MSSLTVLEHRLANYPPRTYDNAMQADLTVAFALDFNTAGERLTKKAAGFRYTWISLTSDTQSAADKLAGALREHGVRTLNIAGNGIYSLEPKGWPQSRVDAFVFTVLTKAIAQWPITKVISGGQTGVDLAGVTAAHALGIPAVALLPKGFLQRGLDNKDCAHTADEVRQQIVSGAAPLRAANRAVHQFREIFPNRDDRLHVIGMIDAHLAQSHDPKRLPRLYNIKRESVPSDVVYIGRGSWRGQKSKLGNPFSIGADGDRNTVCDRFEEWAPTQPEIMAEIEKLRGKDLACYCAPYRCHGDWILKMANRELTPAETASVTSDEPSIQFDPQI